ncbi:MAG: ABC transporter permease [Candidatus Latescibacteria bacterium]|nr:ABC transporter permease [Candidatus Latescibacterota bacterium]
MFRNYLIVAVRNVLRQKLYAFINVFGLAIGLACCILILLYVRHEWQYDAFHENSARIFRVIVRETRPDGSVGFSTLHPTSLAASLKEEFPGIERASGFIRSRTQVSNQKISFQESFGMVEPDFLEMFSFPLLAGDPATTLRRPDGVVISETVARKFFGILEEGYSVALGNPLVVGDLDFTVVGVMADVPETSSLKFSVLIPIEHHRNYSSAVDWDVGKTAVYVELVEPTDVEALEAAFAPFAEKHLRDRIVMFKNKRRVRNTDDGFMLRLQPLRDVYLNSEAMSYYEASGNVVYSYLLAGLAFVVLAVACINCMTLAVGRSMGRATEVGIRKALGAQRRQLMRQFLGEALLLSLLALAIGMAIAEMFLPVFNELARKNLSISYSDSWGTVLALLGMACITGLAAGSYPSLVMPRLNPVTVLKNKARVGGRNAGLRGLVVVQFALSIALMISAAIMFQQLNYLRERDLGYREELVVVVPASEEVSELYKAEISRYHRVVSVTISDRAFTTGDSRLTIEKENGERFLVRVIQIDADFLATMKIQLVAGRNIPPASTSVLKSYALVNEKLAGMLGSEDLVGEKIKLFRELTVAGVVRDFHFDSMHLEIQPLLLHTGPGFSGPFVLIRIQPEDIAGTIALLQKTWEAVASDQPFQYTFLEDNLARQYQSEDRWARIAGYTFAFAILISCLGLLGLASLSVTRRTKEVGIRKALGGSVSNLALLLSGAFVKLVVVANLLAWPVAYYVMNGWLQNFAYRIDPEPAVFILCGILALVIALLTVGVQSMKAALANPVDALRYE